MGVLHEASIKRNAVLHEDSPRHLILEEMYPDFLDDYHERYEARKETHRHSLTKS